jgi:hypothetical protein
MSVAVGTGTKWPTAECAKRPTSEDLKLAIEDKNGSCEVAGVFYDDIQVLIVKLGVLVLSEVGLAFGI